MRALAGSKQLRARERCETSRGRFTAFARRRPKAASPLNAAASPAWRLAASQGKVPGVDPDMLAYYDLGHEAERLFTWGRLERVRTEQLLARHLPPAPATVLDVGGGTGVYALWLAARGSDVHLIDPVELHLAQAREAAARRPDAPLASIRAGDARALPVADASADAVLLLGPLYHLPDAADRRRALAEAHRVLRPGGVLAAAAISRFASTIDGLLKGLLADPEFEAVVAEDLRRAPPQSRPAPRLVHHRVLPPARAARGRGPRRGLRARPPRRRRGPRRRPGRPGRLARRPRAASRAAAGHRTCRGRAEPPRREPACPRARPPPCGALSAIDRFCGHFRHESGALHDTA